MGLNGTPAVLAAAASVLVYFVLRTDHTNRRLAAMGAALVWVWPYAAVWNSVREIGFRGATLCCGLLLVLCALRVYRHRAGPATRVLLGLAAGVGWWASPEIAYFVIPAVVLLVASWDRLYAGSSGAGGRWSAPWHVTPLALTAAGVIVGALPWLYSNVRYRLRLVASRQSGAGAVRLRGPRGRSSSTTCSRRSWACGRYRAAHGWEGAPSGTRSSWSFSSCSHSCWDVQRGRPGSVVWLLRCWPPEWPWWPSPSCLRTSPPPGTGPTPLRRLPAAAPRPARDLVASRPGREPVAGAIHCAIHGADHVRRRRPAGQAAVALASLGLAAGIFSTVVLAHESAGVPTHPRAFFAGWSDPNKAAPPGHRVHGRTSSPHRLRRLLDRLQPRLLGPALGSDQPVTPRCAAFRQSGPYGAPGQATSLALLRPRTARPRPELPSPTPNPVRGDIAKPPSPPYLTSHGDGYRVVHLGVLDAVIPQHPVRHLPPLG